MVKYIHTFQYQISKYQRMISKKATRNSYSIPKKFFSANILSLIISNLDFNDSTFVKQANICATNQSYVKTVKLFVCF